MFHKFSKRKHLEPKILKEVGVEQEDSIKEGMSQGKHVFWPRDLLKGDFPKARIMTFGYNTDITRGYQAAHQGNIFSHARNILYELEDKRRKAADRDLVFIAHSLGGILVKEVLRRSQTDPDTKIQRIFTSTTGVLFFSTLHRGSKDWASFEEGIAGVLGRLLGIDTNNQVIHALLPSGPELALCRESFPTKWVTRGNSLVIVPPESSSLDHPNQRARTIDEDHIGIVKFKGRKDEADEMVKADIEELVENSQAAKETKDTGKNTTKENQECVQHLRVTDPRHDKKRIEDTKGGLLVDSYNWILEILISDNGETTMLLCGIINELLKSTAKADLLSYFFCQATDSRINNATAVLRGLVYMLVDQQPSLVSHIRKKHDHAGKAFFEDANAWVALSEIFTNILQDPSLSSTYLIVDALDECVTGLPKLLDFIVQQSSVSSRVTWIVSSRNWPDIEERLERAGHKVRLHLELNAQSVSIAVSAFIWHKVLQLAEWKRYDDKTRDAVLDHLFSNANDTFLWVALVCQNLEKVPRRSVVKKLTAFPPGLDSLYERMLQQISKSDDAGLCKRILASIAIVFRPITPKELTSVVEILEDMADDLESLREIIGLCGSFLTLREDTVYFVHQSAKDFLLTRAFNEVFPTGRAEIHYAVFL
ncbi:MAG: hypothetical protein Q9217_004209 [Psora testacea]